LDKIKEKEYPIYLFAISLSILWQTSMLGVHIIGADIHSEFSVANQIIENGWDMNFVNPNTTSILIAWISPMLNKLGLSPIWQFKALYPIFLASVPIVLYFAYRKMIGDKRAYYATIFFIIVPVFSLEIITIAKSMVAELFFAFIVLIVTLNIKTWHKAIWILLCAVMATLLHYTIGMLVMLFLLGGICFWVAGKIIRLKIFNGSKVFPVYVSVILILALIATIAWHGNVANGAILTTYKTIILAYSQYINPHSEYFLGKPATSYVPSEGSIEEPPQNNTVQDTNTYLNNQEPLVKLAIGLDFNKVEVEAKIFRVLQYITQLMIVLGLVYLVIRSNKYNFKPDFLILVAAAFGMLGLCVFLPYFSSTINITRFYHVSLFLLSPLFVVGTEELVYDSRRLYNWAKHRQ
jgi:uncharacterized membrane protein